jgi:hypothetical protein
LKFRRGKRLFVPAYKVVTDPSSPKVGCGIAGPRRSRSTVADAVAQKSTVFGEFLQRLDLTAVVAIRRDLLAAGTGNADFTGRLGRAR